MKNLFNRDLKKLSSSKKTNQKSLKDFQELAFSRDFMLKVKGGEEEEIIITDIYGG